MDIFRRLSRPKRPTNINVYHLEEKVLELSGLKVGKEISVFNVPINYKGENYIHTIRAGDSNQVLTLLHGYGGTGVLFYPILKELSKKYQVYCIDLLGMGLSSRPSFDCKTTEESIDFFVESLEKWREALGIERFYLGGHSFGGYIGAHYAMRHPSRVKKLLMLSPVGVTKHEEVFVKEDARKKTHILVRPLFDVYMKFWDEQMTFTSISQNSPMLFDFLLKRFVSGRFGLPKEVATPIYEYLGETFKLPESSEKALHYILSPARLRARLPLEDLMLKYLTVPTVVYYGDHDWMDPVGAYRIARDHKKPNFEVRVVKNAGHQLIIENPEEVVKNILFDLAE